MSGGRHPLEAKFNAPAADILDAIEHGFRAQADVKGKLAELYLSRHLDRLQRQGDVTSYAWNDADGKPDFEVVLANGRRVIVECKNLRSNAQFGPSRGCKVEIQKTRNGVDAQGRKTRGYLANQFDVLAVCTFNQTGRWEFRFASVRRLARREGDNQVLAVMQDVPLDSDRGGWSGQFLDAVGAR